MKNSFKIIGIILIFLAGYTLGVIGIEDILNNVKLELQQMDIVNRIGFYSSITTLFLFFIYIIGKSIIIHGMKNTIYEQVEHICGEENSNLKIIEEYSLGDNTTEKVFFYSSKYIQWIRVYEMKINKRGKIKKGKLIIEHKDLRGGFSIQLNTYLPCGMPAFMVEYRREDYMIGELILAENGKTGLLEEYFKIRHTLRSIIYYFVI